VEKVKTKSHGVLDTTIRKQTQITRNSERKEI